MATPVLLPSCIHRHTFARRRGPLARERLNERTGLTGALATGCEPLPSPTREAPRAANCALISLFPSFFSLFSFSFFSLFRPFFLFLGWRWRSFPRVFHSPSCVLVCACVCVGSVPCTTTGTHSDPLGGFLQQFTTCVFSCLFRPTKKKKDFCARVFLLLLCAGASECVFRGLFCLFCTPPPTPPSG